MSNSNRFLSVDEVAVITTLHPVSIRRMIADGRIPSVKLGKRRLIPGEWLTNLEALAGESKAAAVVGGSL